MSVKSATTSRKLGWCSDNLLSSGDFDTELQTLHREMQTSDQHHKQKDKIRVCKKAQRVRRVLERCLWTDETKMNLWSQAYTSSVKNGGGVVMAWAYMTVSGTGPLIFTDDLMHEDSSRMNFEGYTTILPTLFKKMPPESLGSASYCIRTMTQNTRPVQSRTL